MEDENLSFPRCPYTHAQISASNHFHSCCGLDYRRSGVRAATDTYNRQSKGFAATFAATFAAPHAA